MAFATLLALAAMLAAPDGHPMDGPDAELRLLRTQAGLRLSMRVNLAWCDEVLAEPREALEDLPPEESILIEGAAWQWVQDNELLRSAGAPLTGRLESVQWVPADPERVGYFPRMGMRALTYLELYALFPLEPGVEAVELHWPAFPVDPVLASPGYSPTVKVQAVLMAGPEERVITLTESEPSYRWRLPQTEGASHLLPLPPAPPPAKGANRPLLFALASALTLIALFNLRKNPIRVGLGWVTVMLLGVAHLKANPGPQPIEAETAQEVFQTLHQNLYRAFDFHDQEAVYDALEASTQGELLQRLYREIHSSLVLEEEGGALCRVESVVPIHVEIEPGKGESNQPFRAKAHWRVEGIMHHWGHMHRRHQELQAEFSVAHTEKGWRLMEANITESKRLPLPPEEPGDALPPPQDPEDMVY